MSVADLFSTVSALPRAEKVQLMKFIVDELDRDQPRSPPAFVPPPDDHCPYTPDELAQMFEEQGGQPLSEVWRKLGRI